MSTAYVIHSERDLRFVEETLVRPLPCNGFDRWVSYDLLNERSDTRLSVAQIMAKSGVIVAVISRAFIESSSVRDETAQALASGRPVIAVRIEPDQLPAELSSLQIVDFMPGSEATAWRALAELLPPPDLRTEENGLSSVAKRIEWSEEIFSESLVEALDHHAQSRAQSLVDAFVRHIEHQPDPYPERHANKDLSVLRRQRQFKLMRRYAEAVLQSGTTNETVRRQYAQSLIEQKAFALALEVLFAIVRDPKSKRSEVFEAQGLIGRTYKQRYVDAPDALESDKLLHHAIAAYESVYREDSTQLWHGINAASCILRGHRDGIEGTDPERARKIAREVLERTSQLEESGIFGIWDYATRVEALLALDSYDAAMHSLDAYICHPDMRAFEVSSTYRQFDQLLELGRNERGRPILNRLWETVEQYRAGGFWRRPFATSDSAESVTRQNALRPLLIRVTDPEWEPRNVTDLDVQARLGTIISAEGSNASVKQLLKDPEVISIDESLPIGVDDCDRSVPFIRAAASYPSPGGPYAEKGDAALIAVIDSGIDVLHETFLDERGECRIEGIWDQRDPMGPPPNGFSFGTFHAAKDISDYVKKKTVPYGLGRDPGDPDDSGGHGTHVASIAAGRAVGVFAGGVAPEARILVVISSTQESIGYSKSHIQALTFIDATARRLGLPVVVNVSQGMNAGAHDGKSMLEVAFDEFSKGGRQRGRVIVKSAGNERHKYGHAKVTLPPQSQEELRWRCAPQAKLRERLELWWNSPAEFELSLADPDGKCSDWVGISQSNRSGALGGTQFAMLFTRRHVDNGDSHLRIDLGDGVGAIQAGLWRLQIRNNHEREQGEIHAWIERGPGVPSSFVNHIDEEMTLSIPGTAQSVITVGAVDAAMPIMVCDFSSYGPTRDGRSKPEVAAPGVGVHAALSGTANGVVAKNGTSMAAPHVTGAIALLLSRTAKSKQEEAIPAATQIASALRQKTRNYSSRWDRGQGFGVIDVGALLAAF
jgi:subtilisin family serine protease